MKNNLFARDFSLVVIGQIVSVLGSAILRFALDLYVLDLTGRADIFALVLALSSIPGIVFTPIGGAIADRFSRRNLMVLFDFSNSAVVLLLIALFHTGNGSVGAIGVILAALSVISAVYQPTVQACVPQLVSEETLPTANGIVSGVGALSNLLGPVLGGVLYGMIGLRTLVTLSCCAFFCAAVMELFIRIPFLKQSRSKAMIPTIADDMKDGMHYVVKDNPQILRIVIIGAALNLLMAPFLIIGVPYILRIVMQSSETMYGIGMGIAQFSTILGALLLGVASKKMSIPTLYKPLLLIAVFLIPMALAVTSFWLRLGYWPSFALFFTFGGLIMALVTIISIFVITAVQLQTPNEMLGKVMAIIMAISQCAAPLGQALYGFAFQEFKTVVYVPVILACLFTVIIAFASKRFLRSAPGESGNAVLIQSTKQEI